MGRKPATEDLGLENTDITVTDRGAISVDDYCQTSVEGVYAVGDVTGGPQFTYTSLDDFRIVLGQLTGASTYNHKERGPIPTTTFIEPPLSQVGLTEKEAQEKEFPTKPMNFWWLICHGLMSIMIFEVSLKSLLIQTPKRF